MIYFVFDSYYTFVKEDLKILSQSEQPLFEYKTKFEKNPIKFLLAFVHQLFSILFRLHKIKTFYCWFADYHSVLPAFFARLTGKKCVIIVGGFDAVNIPPIKFGIFYKDTARTKCVKYTYRNCTHIVPVDASLIDSTNYYFDEKGVKQGIKNYVDNVSARYEVVPTGYDDTKWYKLEGVQKEKIVMTVGGSPDERTFKRKGLDFLLQVAKEMPDTKFIIVGLKPAILDLAKSQAPENAELVGYISHEELHQYFSKAKVFCQFSLSEGLPNTLCEAMLCECIPVGSSANGIPYGIGETGFVLKHKNVDEARALINQALNADELKGEQARTRIQTLFSFDKRQQKILDIINE